MTARTATDIVIACENVLGWTPEPTETKPLWKLRAIEAGKLKRKMASDPKKFTFANLELAIEYCRRKREPIPSPASLCWRVDKALELANAPVELSDLATAVQQAIDHELACQRPDRQEWISRLTRSHGPFRADALNDWKAAGRDG